MNLTKWILLLGILLALAHNCILTQKHGKLIYDGMQCRMEK